MGGSPCKNCDKRHPACHGTCDAFLAWTNARNKIKEAMKKEKEKWYWH